MTGWSDLRNIIRVFRVCLPSLEEQKAITSILSVIDEAIQKTNEVIAKTERLKKGLMRGLKRLMRVLTQRVEYFKALQMLVAEDTSQKP